MNELKTKIINLRIANKSGYREASARKHTKQKQKRMKVFETSDNIYDEVDLYYCGEINDDCGN